MTKLTYEDEYQTISVSVIEDDMTIGDFMDEICIPLVESVYCEENVKDWLDG